MIPVMQYSITCKLSAAHIIIKLSADSIQYSNHKIAMDYSKFHMIYTNSFIMNTSSIATD